MEVKEMKNNKLITILTFLVLSIGLIAAAPMAKSDKVSLKIDNESDDYVTLRLTGPHFYFLSVRPNSSAVFTIERGDYEQRFYSCRIFTNTTLDLTKKNTIVVPPCGEKAFRGKGGSKIDGGALIKLVKVTFENETERNLVLILRGPSEYVFFIRSGDEASYTIAKGTYEATQWGCKLIKNFNFYPYANKEKELTCPKP
jgi:hypothetical protein